MGARVFVGLQHLLPQHALSRLVWHVTRSRIPLVRDLLVDRFVAGFRPDMNDAAEPDPRGYPTFNAFFTRALREGARPMPADPHLLTSPVDGAVSQAGVMDGSWLIQAKGHAYTLESLLAGEDRWAAGLRGGSFATLYLAPFDYHRIHMPLPGTLRAAWYVPGRLFSVNTSTAALVPGLFARNERVVLVFEDGPLTWALVMVGALFVGSMSTVWHGDITPRAAPGITPLQPLTGAAPLQLPRGAELGHFNMGSTVILLLPPAAATWEPGLVPGTTVRVGQPLARMT
ncbi:MAG: phosphatidylserine decarboxylase [Proteobacteria bacterium]|nr:phosphatidylserine decarboxylase [Pseudomonadota bacterium]